MVVESVDNISQKVLDTLVEKYGSNPEYRVVDERTKMSFGKSREYFLISNYVKRRDYEWTFIWIGDNLWQYSYLNTRCTSFGKWESPIDILNKLLNN